ncbi:MAG: hypothetical protein M3328_08345 [Chloroflexota bacterium]|nr:hypothetical protein [Chloroflexota bacterium]
MQGIFRVLGAEGGPRLAATMAVIIVLSTMLLGAASPANAQASRADRLAQYRAWMVEAKAMYPYPQTIDKMYRVMMCESSGNPNVVGPQGLYHGLFQYHRGTWGGRWNPYRSQNIYDAKAQIFATAKAWSIGMQSHWSCYYITAGR